MGFHSLYTGEKQSRKSLYHGKHGTNKRQWLPTPQNDQLVHVAKSKPERKEAKEKAAARIQAACAFSNDFDIDHYRDDDRSDDKFDDFEYTGQLDASGALQFF